MHLVQYKSIDLVDVFEGAEKIQNQTQQLKEFSFPTKKNDKTSSLNINITDSKTLLTFNEESNLKPNPTISHNKVEKLIEKPPKKLSLAILE